VLGLLGLKPEWFQRLIAVLEWREYAPLLLSALGSAALLFIVGSRWISKLALGFRAGLDVALDVINWLRLHPLDSNPRARICARYTSLLRHVAKWRDAAGNGYSALVIVAHSQGTVITIDLLRFLQKERAHGANDAQLQRLFDGTLPVPLFTMGCPLRQLYALRFPHLYGWADHMAAAWPASSPDPALLPVKRWLNAYGSGDYVGRDLWHPEESSGRWESDEKDSIREEFCVGATAHTRYWEAQSRRIARRLDELIAAP